jgi:MSHA biogenesis protein MshJ
VKAATAGWRRQFAPLLQAWERQARRIDALSLRERAILFIGIVAVLAALFETLVLSPLAERARLRAQAHAQQAAEIGRLREQFVATSRDGGGPVAQLVQQLDTARAERERLDAELRRVGTGDGGPALPVVLQRLLAQQPGLVLQRLTLLDDAPVTMPAGGSASAPAGLPALAWQGVELQVQGPWREAQRYMQALERELPGLRWGELQLTAPAAPDNAEPPQLRVQAFLLKRQP